MADFCKQCSIEMWGKDTEDFKGIQTAEHTSHGIFTHVICEGCGHTQVNHLGVCVSPDCLERHGKKNLVV